MREVSGRLGRRLITGDEAARGGMAAVRGLPVGDRAVPAVVIQRAAAWRQAYTRRVVAADLAVALLGVLLAATRTTELVDLRLVLGFPPLFVLALALARVYEHRYQGSGGEEFRRLLTAGAVLIATTSTAALALPAPALRGLALADLPGTLLLSLLVHQLARGVLRALRRRGRLRQRVVGIGLERSVAELIRFSRRDRDAGVDVVACCVSRATTSSVEGVPVLGRPEDVLPVLQVSQADTVVLTAWSDVGQDELRRLSWDLEGTGVQLLVAPRLAEIAIPRLHIRTLGGLALLDVDEPQFTGLRRVVKTALDYALAVLATVLLAPLMVTVAVAVRVSSPGPVLFRQERIGRYGRPFVMHKFRSMYPDAEQRLAGLGHLNEHGSGPLFKLRDDPRITRVGSFIRRYSLDELPQLLDVLLGRMSLVGPRPPLAAEVAQYEQDVRRRLLVKPGITGLWQVSGRSDLSWDESVRLDLDYVENWFLGLDLSIIARTVTAVLARRGAY